MDVFEDKNNDGNTPTIENGAAPVPQLDIWVEKLGGIQREDGTPKYESVEAALDALKASQEHISKIEREKAELAAKAAEAETLKETLTRLESNKMNEEKPAGTPPANGGQSPEAAEELVKRLLNQSLAERDQVTTAVNNVKLVQDTLVKKYGEAKAVEMIAAKVKSLGTTNAKLKELSATDPKMVLELFGNTPSATPSVNSGTLNLGYKPAPDDEIQRPEKSLLSGPAATDRNRADIMAKIRANVYKKHGIST